MVVAVPAVRKEPLALPLVDGSFLCVEVVSSGTLLAQPPIGTLEEGNAGSDTPTDDRSACGSLAISPCLPPKPSRSQKLRSSVCVIALLHEICELARHLRSRCSVSGASIARSGIRVGRAGVASLLAS